MFAKVAVSVIYLLLPGSLNEPQCEQPHANANRKSHQITELNPIVTDNISRSQTESLQVQQYQNQSSYDTGTHSQNNNSFVQRINTQASSISTSKPHTTTEYVPVTSHYAISEGKPLSSFSFDDYPEGPEDIFYQRPSTEDKRNDQLVALPLWGTEAMNDEIGDRLKELGDKQTNLVGTDPNWNQDTGNTKKTINERLPWQASVFSKQEEPFRRVCGASMVMRDTLISAAHCFWKEGEGLFPASMFAVGADEVLMYQLDDYSSHRQQSDVGSIKIPPTFSGAPSYQHDIAVVKLARPFYDATGMRPVCVNFDDRLEAEQLKPGNIATTLGVGLQQKGRLTALQILKVPYISWNECEKTLDGNSLQYSAEDKICAGFRPGLSPVLGEICSRDSGAGLAFNLGDNEDITAGIAVPFLRGVASLSRPCDARERTLYTKLRSHRKFLEENIKGLVEECGKYYKQLGFLLAKGHSETRFVCDCYC